jgi:hypothetical protein
MTIKANHATHFIEKGNCGHVIAQCRCFSKDKTVITRPYPCEACRRAQGGGRAV